MVVCHQLQERGWIRKVLDFIDQDKTSPLPAGGGDPFFKKVFYKGVNPCIKNSYITGIFEVNKIGGLTPFFQLILKVTENTGLTDLTRPVENNNIIAINEFIDLIHNGSFENFFHCPPDFVSLS